MEQLSALVAIPLDMGTIYYILPTSGNISCLISGSSGCMKVFMVSDMSELFKLVCQGDPHSI